MTSAELLVNEKCDLCGKEFTESDEGVGLFGRKRVWWVHSACWKARKGGRRKRRSGEATPRR